MEGLKECRPTAAYINHIAFLNNNPNWVVRPTQPVLKRVFTDATEYFLYTGLGFLSALVLKHVEEWEMEGTAHVEIAGRVVLSTKGPYLFDGTITVLARHDEQCGYCPLRFGAMNLMRVHERLNRDGLLSDKALAWFRRKAIRSFLPRAIMNNRINRRPYVGPVELWKMFGGDPWFYLIVLPMAAMPAWLVRLMGLPARSVMRMNRRRQAKQGRLRRHSTHFAPRLS